MTNEKLAAMEVSLKSVAERLTYMSEENTAARQPRGGALLKYLGVAPDRFLERFYENSPETDFYEALYGGSESLRGRPAALGLRSGLCRQLHFSTDEFRYWMGAMARPPRMHRKEWEWFYIAQALFERGMLEKEKKGLAFAVGQEPLPSVFALYGCKILATDQAPDQAVASGWAHSNMYSAQIDTLFNERICSRDQFQASVHYAHADMNDIPSELSNSFDFCWSSCAFEHLGSLEHGMRFVERSIETLKPGGIAVHTTEYNLSSNDETIESPGLSVFRRRDIDALVQRLESNGHHVEPFDWTSGPGFAETVVDLPPYKQSPHLKLKIHDYECTSIGLIIQKT